MLFFYYLRKFWSEVLVSIAILGILWLLIFYWYPHYLMNLFIHHNPTSDLSHEAEGYGRGTFGDMYGPLNTFLSGLAFVGAVIAIILQVYQINLEKRKRKDEIKVQLNLFKWHLEKLKTHYLKKLQAYLNWDGESLNLYANGINVKDDYSFKEILNMNILDIYRGLIEIGLNQQTAILIEFIIKLKGVHEDYLNARNFKQEHRDLIKAYNINLKLSGEKLREELTEQGKEQIAKSIIQLRENYFYFYDTLNWGDSKIDIALKSLSAHSEYLEVLEKNIDIKWYESENSNKLDRIFELNNLIENLINGIPTLTINVISEL